MLVAAGSGVVPLMAMLRHRRRVAPELPMRLLYLGAGFVSAAGDLLIEAGADRPMIRTERFGPTGA